ncbi:MAG: energy transducer TonB [Xanthomonadaceae bacterium]|nr:energy transducer TonB [Xanthomonadaceae bacterium]
MSRHQESNAVLRVALAGALACGLVACGDKQADQAAASNAATKQAAAAPTQAVAAAVAAMSPEQLREAATQAVAEQRLYAPAANNAMEYYLALRDKAPTDAAVSGALTDLQPYALIATEQAITRDDFAEAQRLYALLEKTDANAPALPRLKQSIADAQQSLSARQQQAETNQADAARLAQLERERLAEQQKMQQQAAQQLAARQAEEKRVADLRAAETERQQQASAAQQAREAEERRQAEQRAAAQRPTATAPAPTPAAAAPAPRASNELVAISTPQPKYPTEALRSGQSGTVQVEFTVGPNGSVTSARVVSANPPRVFNTETLNAVKRWRFQPVGSPVTSRRTISFSPAN